MSKQEEWEKQEGVNTRQNCLNNAIAAKQTISDYEDKSVLDIANEFYEFVKGSDTSE